MTIEIPLSKGYVALVDDADAELVLSRGPWHARVGSRTAYAVHTVYVPVRTYERVLMHKLLTGWDYVDHINGHGWDNRRANLRPSTAGDNARNRRRHVNNTVGFKGVIKDGNRYRAHITINYRRIGLGTYATAEEAARVYDAAARELQGEFARCNDWPAET